TRHSLDDLRVSTDDQTIENQLKLETALNARSPSRSTARSRPGPRFIKAPSNPLVTRRAVGDGLSNRAVENKEKGAFAPIPDLRTLTPERAARPRAAVRRARDSGARDP